MKIVASNSLTVSNVNDGTITHTAYSWSSDGTDRFTTDYRSAVGLDILNIINWAKSTSLSNSTYKFVSNADSSFKVTGKGTGGYEVLSKSFPAKIGDKLRFTVRYTNRLAFGLYNDYGLQFVTSGAYTESVTSTSKIVLPNVITASTEYQLEYTATTSNIWMQLNFGGVADSAQVDFDVKIEVENLTNPVKYAYMGTYTDYTANDSTNPSDYTWSRILGEDGQTAVVHWAYSDNADGTGFTTTDNSQRYIGHYSDYTQADSTDKTKYSWADRWAKIEVGGRNLAQKTSSDWSNPYTSFSGSANTCPRLYKVLIDDLVVGDTLKSRIVLKYTNIIPASGQTARIWLQGDGDVTTWNAGSYPSSTHAPISGSGEMVFEHEFKITADHLKNQFWNWQFRTDYIASGSLQWKLVKVEKGTVYTDWSPAPEDIQADIDSKADQALTQEQINALNENNQILESEMQAKASMEAFSDLEKTYQSFVKANEDGQAKAEADLIEAGRRIELLTTQFGGLAELKTFIDTYMSSSNEGLIIGKNDASSTIKVSSDRISMFSAGEEVMYISQGVININNGIFTASVQIGKFRTEQYHLNADMNVIRYVGE